MSSAYRLLSHYDAVIVGARCAGAATALLLARAGLKVLVIERHSRGSDTLSTHALMRTGVVQLQRWGLLDAVVASGAPPIRTTSIQFGRDEITIPIKPAHGVNALYAPRRPRLAVRVALRKKVGARRVSRAKVWKISADGRCT